MIIGEDDYLVQETAKKLIGEAGPALEVIDSNAAANAELQLRDIVAADASFSTPPFLDPVKVTWWRNVGFLPCGGRGGPSEAVKTALEKFARKLAANPLPENQRFILSGPRLLQTSVFAKTLKGAAEMAVFAAGRPWEQARAAAERVAGKMFKDEKTGAGTKTAAAQFFGTLTLEEQAYYMTLIKQQQQFARKTNAV